MGTVFRDPRVPGIASTWLPGRLLSQVLAVPARLLPRIGLPRILRQATSVPDLLLCRPRVRPLLPQVLPGTLPSHVDRLLPMCRGLRTLRGISGAGCGGARGRRPAEGWCRNAKTVVLDTPAALILFFSR
jgi:hypothetical protein